MNELYIYKDEVWSRHLAMAAARKGMKPIFFSKAHEVPVGSLAFIRLDQYQAKHLAQRDLARQLYEKGVKMFPSWRECLWYDDKIAQLPVLEKWLPKTKVYTIDLSKYSASDYTDIISNEWNNEFPLISKSSEGASSANVRMINTIRELSAEIELIGKAGYPMSYNRKQKWYIYLQRYIDCQYDYRILVMGDYIMGKKRYIKSQEEPFASGSGKHEVITEVNEENLPYLKLADEICYTLGIEWVALDFVKDKLGQICVLEMSTSWSTTSNLWMPMFMRANYTPSKFVKAHMFDILANLIKEAA